MSVFTIVLSSTGEPVVVVDSELVESATLATFGVTVCESNSSRVLVETVLLVLEVELTSITSADVVPSV